MFSWFKSKPSAERQHRVELSALGAPFALAGVKKHWSTGNKQEGDELFESFFKVALLNFTDPTEFSAIDLREKQFTALLEVMDFLIEHDKKSHFGEVLKILGKFLKSKKFDVRQIEQILERIERAERLAKLHLASELVEGWINFLSAEGEGKSRSLLDTKCLTFQRTSEQNSESVELFALLPNLEDSNHLVIIDHGRWKAAQEHLRRFADSSEEEYSKQFEQICQRLTSDSKVRSYHFQIIRKGRN